jgi:hypothetical protein
VIFVENESNENAMSELKQNCHYVRSSKIFDVYISREIDHDVENNELVA